MNGYEWDGTRWVAQTTGGHPGQGWAPPAPPGMPASSPFPSITVGSVGFTEPRYGYGLTRQASDDIQFIARYTKIVIILGLVILGLLLITQVVTVLGLIGLVGTITHR